MAAKKEREAAVLVIGAGIAGIKAAVELAESGAKVYLCEFKPYIGGTLLQLDKWFPDNHCGMCQILPVFNRDRSSQHCLRSGLVHPNIKLLPLTKVQRVEGESDNFMVTLGMESSWVKQELCIGCGLCEQACPLEVNSEFNQGLEKHKAIYPPHPLIHPKVYNIDKEYCTRCGACVDVCPTGAIALSAPDETQKIGVGAIILSTGFESFDPLPVTQYGYRRYPNVITSIEMERLLSNTGHSQGKLIRRSDGKIPKSVAFVQCVGSRDLQRNYCSSVCCMYAIKEALLIKEANPETDINIFFMDLRTFGKDCYRYYEQARDESGVKFTRCRIPAVRQDFSTKDLLITAKDYCGELTTERFDLVVLSVGQAPSLQSKEMNEILGLESNKWGFCETKGLSLVETNRQGIYVCGSASGPKDIADTLTEATAAAGHASTVINPAKPSSVEPWAMSDEEPKVAVYICRCEEEITRVVNIKELVEFSQRLPGVIHVQEIPYLCYQEKQKSVTAEVKKIGVNRAIIVACSDVGSNELFDEIPSEVVNIREQIALVHKNQSKAATEKAKSLIAMALEKMKLLESSPLHPESVTPKALVIGGGLAGLTAALSIAERGFEVEMVEKLNSLGGNMRHIHYLLEGEEPQAYLERFVEEVESSPLIHLWLEAEVLETKGYAGNFSCTLRDKDSECHSIEVGAIIAATGAGESHPNEYLYGQAEQVITQRELEEKIYSEHLNPRDLKSIVMIQCVGSREEQRPYCSRVCCSTALKNALTLKRQNPEIEIIIFYRDLMSYGFREEYYTTAREQGVLFIQYDIESKPEVTFDGREFKVQAVEPVTGGNIIIKPDLVVLSPAIVPYDNSNLARMLGVELTDDGFFKEAEAKFRPVDFPKEGVFICGLAHSPRDVRETIVQAQAAAQRTTQLLQRGELTAGRVVSQVNERWCSGCELCVRVCPYEARAKDPERGVVVVHEALCQGCGACVVACPNGAASLREFQDKQILSMLNAAL